MAVEKVRICFVVSSFLTARVFLKNQIEHLSQFYDVYIVGNFSPDDEPELRQLPVQDVRSVAIHRKINLFADFFAVIELYRYLRKMKFQVVHSVTPKAGLVTALAGKLSAVPERVHIFTGQVWATKKGVVKAILKFCDRIIASFSTKILVDSKGQREFLLSEGVIKAGNSQVLGNGSINGVDGSRFRPDLKVRSEVRELLKIEAGRIVFLYLGRLNRDKGVMDLVNAFQSLHLRYPEAFLLIVGMDEENLVEVIKGVLEPGSYCCARGTATPQIYYQAADIFCLPSYREGFGTSVLEASSTAIPVICSDAYGLKDAIVCDVTGLRHEVGNIEQLLSCMSELASKPELRNQLGKNGRSYTETYFSEEILLNEWEAFYREIVETK